MDANNIQQTLKEHEDRIKKLEDTIFTNSNTKTMPQKTWYKPNSTVAKIINLIEEGFFNQNKQIGAISEELKKKDYHLKTSDLTLPLRKIVRKGLLKREKINIEKKEIWCYIKV